MGSLAKFFSYPHKILVAFFLTAPKFLGFAILAICILRKHYKLATTKYKHMSMINKKSSKFHYRKKEIAELCECSVCLSEFEEGEEARELVECKHAFHRHCLEKWLKGSKATCPICRSLVVPEVIVAEYNKMKIEEKEDWIEKELALILLNILDGRSCNGFF